MKRILLTIIISLAFLVPCCAANGYRSEEVVTEEKKPEGAKCPHTTITDQKKCYDCHEIRQIDGHWKWSIKEQDHKNPKRLYEHPDWVMIVNGEAQGCFDLYGQVSSAVFRNFSEYVYQQGFKKVLVDISSGGGSLIEGWEICSLIGQMTNRGIKVTTQVRAYCASAAFLVFVSGSERLVEPTAYMMTHELWTLAWLKLETPSSKEDEAITMRMFQDVIHEWLAERSGTTKEKLDEMVRHKDWWMSGKAAVKEWHFADGFIK